MAWGWGELEMKTVVLRVPRGDRLHHRKHLVDYYGILANCKVVCVTPCSLVLDGCACDHAPPSPLAPVPDKRMQPGRAAAPSRA